MEDALKALELALEFVAIFFFFFFFNRWQMELQQIRKWKGYLEVKEMVLNTCEI